MEVHKLLEFKRWRFRHGFQQRKSSKVLRKVHASNRLFWTPNVCCSRREYFNK